MENIVLDIIPGAAWPVCHASQCDVGRVIQINLKEISEFYTFTDERIIFEMKKPSGDIVTADVVRSLGSNILYLSTTAQMCACPGSNVCEISLKKKKYRIGSINFILEVEEDPDNNVESTSEIGDLDYRILDAIKIWKT